jgi:tellurite resistance protein TerC
MDLSVTMWGSFFAIVAILLALDLGVFNRTDHEIGVKESLKMSAFYITIGLLFGVFVWVELGAAKGNEYLAGFLVEKSLSLDNIFVISLIFQYFAIPSKYQHRVLFWGIIGVLILRGIAIGLGTAIVQQFEWVLLIFAAFLVFSGIKLLFAADDDEQDIAQNKLLKWLRGHLPITEELHGRRFSVLLPHAENPKKKVRYYTPLFLCLVLVEVADLIFALDSIPAIFAITTDAYIVFTSNVFAILGLRSLYFALNAVLHRFEYLKYALSLVLIFIGGKVLVAHFLGIEKIPSSISLAVTIGLLAGGVFYSMYRTKKDGLSEGEAH